MRAALSKNMQDRAPSRQALITFAVGVCVGRWSASTPEAPGRRRLLAEEGSLRQRHAAVPDAAPGLEGLPRSPFDAVGARRLAGRLCRESYAGCPRPPRLPDAAAVDANFVVNGAQPLVLVDRSNPDASQVSTVGTVVAAYDRVFEAAKLFSYTNWLGVSLQQDPSDAFALADLLWRTRPEVVIELGTNAGGGAFFFAHVLRQYSATARVLTLDPSDRCCAGASRHDWNDLAGRVCPHCTRAADSPLWRSGAVEFIHGTPSSANVVAQVRDAIGAAAPVMVIEDSNHGVGEVLANLRAYAGLVSPGQFFVVQDTKIDRIAKAGPAAAVRAFLAEDSTFEIDRRPEYFVYSQHSGGFRRKL